MMIYLELHRKNGFSIAPSEEQKECLMSFTKSKVKFAVMMTGFAMILFMMIGMLHPVSVEPRTRTEAEQIERVR